MRNLLVAATLALTALGAGAPAMAQVNMRQERQAERIQQGVRSGELTPMEARRARMQQRNIARQESRMRARNGGRLTRAQRYRLQQRQRMANQRIYRLKHNRRGY